MSVSIGKLKQPEMRGRRFIDPRKVPDMVYRESVKVLRTKLETRMEAERINILAVTSAVSGEGKTLLTGALAVNMAAQGNKRVLLIDADLRKADLCRSMQIPISPGLAEYAAGVAGKKDVIRNSGFAGLFVVSSGIPAGDPATLLGGQVFRKFLHEVDKEFDIVVLDTPPLLPVADTMALRANEIGFVLVVRVGYTPQSAIRQAIDSLEEKNIIGVVLNDVEQETQRYYQKYYGSYYRSTEK